MSDMVDVYVKATGVKQVIPAEWLDHPVLGEPFRKTPLSEKQQRTAGQAAKKAGDPPTDPIPSTEI